MKIECLTTFLEGKDRFEKDDIRSVPDALAYKFIGLGWAKEVGQLPAAEPAVGEVNLDIRNSTIGQRAKT